jgi:metal-dependent amidase/aminoacylase/carboxypeptidase family protein
MAATCRAFPLPFLCACHMHTPRRAPPGTTTNVIPDKAVLKGTIRDFNPDVGATLLRRLKEVVTGAAASYGVDVEFLIDDSYPSIVNAAEPTALATAVCKTHFGAGSVLENVAPMSGAEDFSYFAQAVPGCFIFIGGGDADTACPIAHQASYNYNDKITPIAMGLWVKIVEARFGVEVCPEADFFPALPPVDPAALAKFVEETSGAPASHC